MVDEIDEETLDVRAVLILSSDTFNVTFVRFLYVVIKCLQVHQPVLVNRVVLKRIFANESDSVDRCGLQKIVTFFLWANTTLHFLPNRKQVIHRVAS